MQLGLFADSTTTSWDENFDTNMEKIVLRLNCFNRPEKMFTVFISLFFLNWGLRLELS